MSLRIVSDFYKLKSYLFPAAMILANQRVQDFRNTMKNITISDTYTKAFLRNTTNLILKYFQIERYR